MAQFNTNTGSAERVAEAVYTRDDCGCYVDGSRGIYMVDRIVDIARAHGAVIVHDCTGGCSSFATCEFSGDYQDEAEVYMNENFCPAGCYWGESNYGDWGLWEIDE